MNLGGYAMLLKELAKNSRVCVKDLILTPVGAVCYLVDGLHSGYSASHIVKKLRARSHSKLIEPYTSDTFIKYLEMNYQNISCLNDVYSLC